MKKHLIIVFTGCILGILSYLFMEFIEERNVTELLLSGLLGIFIAYSATALSNLLNKAIPWKKHTGLRLLGGIISLTGIAFLLGLTGIYLFVYLRGGGENFWEHQNEIVLKLAILLFFISLIYNVVYFALHSYYQYAKGQLMELKLERKQTELQLAALKSQLSPHFLFNSINTVSSLLFKDIKKAERFIRELAHSYRYTLNVYEDRLVSVEEELTFVNSYAYLLKTRFGNHMVLDIELAGNVLNTRVPPLTLQMLVENAVKHNQMSSGQKLNISINSDGRRISVSNNKTISPNRVESFKIGLNNIASRYRLLAEKEIEIINDEEFSVHLPIIE
ncbi:hypothetical protein GWK08_08985 [Leptobacterium flavescens]|uniref:Signal transduction histidine kinase internal region domain-containing protein n=1 Tax=Leptobacterium flavescens TaxID=472055 RepID=A0A6P0UNZ7_9FLAO|nr:histidine kinase [Leptobacterium flavescens]NER13569.1 hypothetical protein [Leptobacterium flavescens]